MLHDLNLLQETFLVLKQFNFSLTQMLLPSARGSAVSTELLWLFSMSPGQILMYVRLRSHKIKDIFLWQGWGWIEEPRSSEEAAL